MQVCHVLTVLTSHLHLVGTTRGSPSQSQTLATQASRNTKSPQCPTPHSTTPRSSKSMGKVWTPNFFFLHCTNVTANSQGLVSYASPLSCSSHLFSPDSILEYHLEGITYATPSHHQACGSTNQWKLLPFHKHFSVWWGALLPGIYLGFCLVCDPSTQDIQHLCVCASPSLHSTLCVSGIIIHLHVTDCSGKLVCNKLHMLQLVLLSLCLNLDPLFLS